MTDFDAHVTFDGRIGGHPGSHTYHPEYVDSRDMYATIWAWEPEEDRWLRDGRLLIMLPPIPYAERWPHYRDYDEELARAQMARMHMTDGSPAALRWHDIDPSEMRGRNLPMAA